MAIRYGATNIWEQYAADTKALLIEGLYQRMLNAGWTVKTTVGAYVVLTYTGQPADAQTCVFNGTTYTAKNTPTLPTHYQIGADAKTTYDNLAAAIESNDANLNAANSGSGANGTLTVSWGAAPGYGWTASESLNNATLDATTARYGGYKMASAVTPEGLQMLVRLEDYASSDIKLSVAPYDESTWYAAGYLVPSAGRVFEFIGCEYQFFTFIACTQYADRTEFSCGVPALRAAEQGPVIASVADSGGAFEVTTTAAHGYATSDHVYIGGAKGVSGLNGFFNITVTGDTTFVLDGSTYGAGYLANTGIAASGGQTSRAIWALGSNSSANVETWGWHLPTFQNGSQLAETLFWNQYSWQLAQGTRAYGSLNFMSLGTLGSTGAVLTTGICGSLMEPRVCWQPVSAATSRQVGTLWGSFLVIGMAAPAGLQQTGFDGHNWYQYTNDTRASFWIAVS